MRILLITPVAKGVKSKWLPVGLAYIAANLKQNGHDVRLCDRHLEYVKTRNPGEVNKRLKELVMEFSPDLIGLSTFSPVIYDTVTTVRFLRNFYKGIVVAGGHHATALPFETLKRIPGLDYIITGEAELALTALADGKEPDTVPGVITRETKSKAFTTSQSFDLDSLPYPDYSIFDMNYYAGLSSGSIRGFLHRTADIVSSRGCPNNCVFCSETLTYGKGVRYHSPGYTANVIEKLVTDYDITGLYFHDNDFLISRDHASGICEELIRRGLNKKVKWAVQSGTNRIDGEILRLLSRAGCIKIEFGMESIEPEHLKGIRKNRSVEMSENAIELCRENGVYTHGYFMTGFEGETLDDLNALLEWIKIQKLHTFQLSLTQIYPGTKLYETHGNSFFENNPWTDYNINKFYYTDFFSDIPEDQRSIWTQKIFLPYYSKHIKKALIRTNPMSTILRKVINDKLYRF